MILDLFIHIIQFYINQNTFLPGFIIRKGTILYVVTLVAFVIGFITLNFFVGVEQLLLIPLNRWLLYGSVFAIIINILGYFTCLKIYEIRHS